MKTEIRKLLGTDKIVLGTERTIKALKAGKIKQVLVCANCSAETRATITEVLGKAKVVEMTESNEELGVLCKKPFRVAVIGLV